MSPKRKADIERVSQDLEAFIPEVREDIKGKDFRPGGRGDEIVSGVRYAIADITESPYCKLSVLFGGEVKCRAAAKAIFDKVGVKPSVTIPQNGSQTWHLQWTQRLSWQPPAAFRFLQKFYKNR